MSTPTTLNPYPDELGVDVDDPREPTVDERAAAVIATIADLIEEDEDFAAQVAVMMATIDEKADAAETTEALATKGPAPISGTASALAISNPILTSGQIGYATDIDVVKVGDGVTAWNSLPTYQPSTADIYDSAEVTGTLASIPNTGLQWPDLTVSYESNGVDPVQVEAWVCGSAAAAANSYPRLVIYDSDNTTLRAFCDGASAVGVASSCGPLHVITRPLVLPAGARTFHIWAFRTAGSSTVTLGVASGVSWSAVRPAHTS